MVVTLILSVMETVIAVAIAVLLIYLFVLSICALKIYIRKNK